MMPRLTISLSDERYQALKEAATKRHKSLVSIIDESLEFCGIKSGQTAAELVEKARQSSALSENDALTLAVEETHLQRQHQ
jgi:predicted transcriptional regulator